MYEVPRRVDGGSVLGCKGNIGEDVTSEFCGSNRVGDIPFPVVSKVFAAEFIKDSGGARPGVDDNGSGLWKFDDDGLSNLVDDLFRADGGDLDGADHIESQKQQATSTKPKLV